MSVTIISKNYEHYNRTLGKYISSKKQYFDELKRGGYVPYEEGNKLADSHNKERQWKPSGECIDIVRDLYSHKGKEIKLSHYPKIVNAMEKRGMSFDMSKLPKHYQEIK